MEKPSASLSEVRRGVLELALLGLLAKEPSHGYALLERLSAFATLDIAAGTLYPLLRRLERDCLVRSDWTEPHGGPPRKGPGIDYRRFKTRLCVSYQNTGHCSWGNMCAFAHGLHEICTPAQAGETVSSKLQGVPMMQQ